MKRDTRTQRYIDLIEQLGNEAGKKRGWQKAVADRLDVSAPYISRLIGGTSAKVGEDTIAMACRRLEVRPAYFDEPKAAPYRDFLFGSSGTSNAILRLGEAVERAEKVLRGQQNVLPKATSKDLRKMALAALDWAKAEIEHLNGLRARAQAVVEADDSEIAPLGDELASELYVSESRRLR